MPTGNCLEWVQRVLRLLNRATPRRAGAQLPVAGSLACEPLQVTRDPRSWRESYDGIIIYIFRRYRNMALTYNDVVSSLFGGNTFSSREFARMTGNPRAAKVLSELKHRGLVERVARGTYRCLSPEDRPDLRGVEWARVRNIVLSGPGPKAWAGATAVEHWTGGRYKLAPSLYSRVYSLAIPSGREKSWREYLTDHGVSTTARKRVGARVELIPRRSLKASLVNGEPVIPRSEVVAIIKEHPALYGDARELLLDRR
jgi:hypothetical protein